MWGRTLTLSSDVPTSLRVAAELVRKATGSSSPIETPGGVLPPGENQSYQTDPDRPGLGFEVRPLEEGILAYVEWLRRHPAAQGRTRA
jgi:nucleoside-diphosphate-sugar epimerase